MPAVVLLDQPYTLLPWRPLGVGNSYTLNDKTAMPYARPPAPLPSLPKVPRRRHILFRHPGYDDSNNVLFKLFTTAGSHDGEEEASQRPVTSSLHAQFALDACAVLAGNRSNGWLSTSRNPNEACDNRIDAGSTLVARSYRYHLDGKDGIDVPDGPYRIVSFREWCIPHERIPVHCEQLSANAPS
ncbi:hypothetical protein G6011_03979 [Alternaria panax]|uniref:Uncharacterized protein n=1 Tax=Alternaria panax TaxID=48097 RepID=A0AAD4NTS5_9PLEO|nr:hypothetical protein G6011_03979 [Alternaria panax]